MNFYLQYLIFFRAMKERIKSKLRDTKKEPKKVENFKVDDDEGDKDIKNDEYYLGKDRDEERKKKVYVLYFYLIFFH